MKIYLLGVYHSAHRPLTVDFVYKNSEPGIKELIDSTRKNYQIKLKEYISKYDISLIGEEMNRYEIRGDVDNLEFITENICKEKNIEHLFCDPTEEEKEKLGIYYNVWNTFKENYDSYNSPREEEWLRRIFEKGKDNVLLVCGESHISTLSVKLKQKNIEYEILDNEFCRELLDRFKSS